MSDAINRVHDHLKKLDEDHREPLRQIGLTIGFGNAQRILGELWDEMLTAEYGISGRGQMGVTVDDDLPPIPKPKALRRQARTAGGYDMVPAYSRDELKAFARAAVSKATPGPRIVKMELEHPGIYASVNLNGFTLTNHALPPENLRVVLGYRVPHLPEVWFGIGYRRSARCGSEHREEYWLGARGLDPNYDHLNADQVVMWKAIEMPFCFDEGRPDTSNYLQYRYVVGDAPWETEEASKHGRAPIAKANGGTS